MPESADILLRALGAEDGDRNRPAPRDVVAVDAGRRVVTQPDGLGALDKTTFGAQFHQRHSATALAEKIRSTGSVGQQRIGAGHEDEARLLKARRGGFWPDADNVAQ